MKKEYTELEIEIIRFDVEDVIITSGCHTIQNQTAPDEFHT